LLVTLLLATSAGATSFTVSATIDGAQETPPVITPGLGTLTGTYDDGTNFLTWSGSFSGLVGTTTDAHFHGPAAVGVGPAGVVFSITAAGGDIFPLGVTAGPFSGTHVLSAAHESALLSGLLYVNIHSTFKPGGEIRGQVYAVPVPEPSTVALLAFGMLALARLGRRNT
jgi:hypothetical protein